MAFQETKAVSDTNLYKVEHCQNSYKEFLNYCATSENKDTEQVYEEAGNENIFACQAQCNQKHDCTAIEWYSGNETGATEDGSGICLLTITEWG